MVKQGKLLIGLSAGSIMMSKTIKIADYIDENIVDLQNLQALDLVDFEFMPHWETQEPRLQELLDYSAVTQNTTFYLFSTVMVLSSRGTPFSIMGTSRRFGMED